MVMNYFINHRFTRSVRPLRSGLHGCPPPPPHTDPYERNYRIRLLPRVMTQNAQVGIDQQGGDDRPLRGAPFTGYPLAVFNDSGFGAFVDEPQYSLVGNTVLQEFEHPVEVDGVEVRADVCVSYPSNLPGTDSHPYRVERVVLPSPSPESIRESKEVCIKNALSTAQDHSRARV